MAEKRKEYPPRVLTIFGDHMFKNYFFDKFGDCSRVMVHKWSDNGAERIEYQTVSGRLDGSCKLFYPNGTKQLECTFSDGQPHGKLNAWHAHEKEAFSVSFENGIITKLAVGKDDEGNKIPMTEEEIYNITRGLVRDHMYSKRM